MCTRYAMLVSPSVALADEANEQPIAEETANPETTANTKEKPEANEEAKPAENSKANDEETNLAAVEEDKVEPTEVKEEAKPAKAQGAEKSEEPQADIQPTSEEKSENEVTDESEAEETGDAEKKLVTLDEYNKIQENEETAEEKTQEDDSLALEIAEGVEPETLQAGETESKDISDSIINPVVKLNTDKTEKEGKLMAGNGEPLGYEVSFTTPKDTKSGDTFTLKLSENMSLKGIEPDTEEAVDIEIDGKVIAKGKRIDRQTIVYTFTDEINDRRRVKLSLKGFAFDNKDLIRDSKDQDFSIKVGNNSDTKKLYVDYGKNYYTGPNLNGSSQFTSFDPKTGDFTQVFYVNPDSKHIEVYSGKPSPNRISMIIDPSDDRGNKSDLIYTKENTNVFVQKLDKGAHVPDAIFEHPTDDLDETMVKTTFLPEGIEIVFADQKDEKLADEVNSPYIVTVKSHIDIKDIDNFNLTSKGILYGDVMGNHTMFNQIKVAKGDSDAEGEKLGYFKEHHKYYDKVDGVLRENPTFIIDSSTDEGIAEETYTTSKNEIGSYKFIRIDEDALVENPKYNKNGEKATGNFEEEKTKEVTYIYVRDVTSGKFQEHHIYQTVDEDDNVISTDDTVNKDETKGIDEDSYKTSKIDRDGYTLTEVKATNDESKDLGVQFDGQGAETSGNYVNGKKLEVTYIYQKKEVTKGNFIEHHIYQTVDEDDKVISTDDTVNKEATTGKETEKYTTVKEDRDGYKLTKVEGKENAKFNKDGSKAEGNYVKGKTQEVTYTYQKKVVTKGSFQEHHIYITKDEDGKEVSREVVDGTETSGKKEDPYTTSAKEKDGFKFVKTQDPKENPSYDSNGAEKTGNYVAGKKQEITYVYEKTVRKPKEDPKPVDPTTPVDPEEPTPVVPTTPVDPEEPTPIIPAEPIEDEPGIPVENEDKPVVETEEKDKTVEDKDEEKTVENTEEASEKVKNSVEESIKVPRQKISSNPKTGVASSLGVMGTLAASALAFLGLDDKKRKNK